MFYAFDYSNIALQDSMVNDSIQETMEFYLNIPCDNFFKYMREDAGLDAPGVYYQGWFKNSRGVMLTGQWISAFCRMYAFTGREEFKEKAVFLFEEFKKCHDLLAGTPKALLKETSHYDYEKILRAICDLHLYCQYEKAAQWLPWLLEFARTTLTRDNLFGDNTTEWYTVAESLYMIYQIFHLEEARELAAMWEYREFWDLFYKDQDPFSKKPRAGLYSEFCHAYSHANSFNGCARAYEITGNPYYLRALRKFYGFMQKEEVMATGGYGPNFEHIMPKYRIIDALRTGHDSFETQCDTYAAFRLSDYLTRFTGEPQYGNWVESLIFNAAVATIPMTEDGRVIYYSDYNMYGAAKVNRTDGWTCCTGTRPLLVMEIPRLIYYTDGSGLFVDQYIPSTLNCTLNGIGITLSQQTSFPLQDEMHFSLKLSEEAEFTLNFRMPVWLEKQALLTINGQAASATVSPEGWLMIKRRWHNGDSVKLTLPQTLWMHSLDPVLEGPNAFLHGPVVLAASYPGPQTPNDWMDIRRLTEKMEEIPGRPLHYRVKGNDAITFKPFYEYKEHERYFLYHDTTAHASRRF